MSCLFSFYQRKCSNCALTVIKNICWQDIMVFAIMSEEKITMFQAAFAGATAGALTRAIAQPLDVLKIRLQLQLEPIKHGSKYTSLVQTVTSIAKEEGISTLWSGHIPAQLLSITYGIIQFSAFEKLTQLCQRGDPQFYMTQKHWVNFSNGAIAASLATVASFPFDTVRTRLIAEQKTRKVYTGCVNVFTSMIKVEGPMALFKGLMPTLSQIAPHTGIQFAVYKLFTENILTKIAFFQRPITISGTVEATMFAYLVAGSISGFIAKTAIYPFDVIKKRLQIQGFQHHRKSFGRQMYCNGSLQCIRLVLTEEGFKGLYKGYWPSMAKAVLVSALHFAFYDEIKHFLIRTQN